MAFHSRVLLFGFFFLVSSNLAFRVQYSWKLVKKFPDAIHTSLSISTAILTFHIMFGVARHTDCALLQRLHVNDVIKYIYMYHPSDFVIVCKKMRTNRITQSTVLPSALVGRCLMLLGWAYECECDVFVCMSLSNAWIR